MKKLFLISLVVFQSAFASDVSHEGGGATVGNGNDECSELSVIHIRMQYQGSRSLRAKRLAFQALLSRCPDLEDLLYPNEYIGD